jgi:SsrA-binding protein
VKSIRDGKVALVYAYAVIEKNEAWLCELEIGVHVFADARNHDPPRRRKLLLHRGELDRLADKVRGKGLTLVPLSLYEKDGRVKVELALVHGKQEYDRRDDVKKTRSPARDRPRHGQSATVHGEFRWGTSTSQRPSLNAPRSGIGKLNDRRFLLRESRCRSDWLPTGVGRWMRA